MGQIEKLFNQHPFVYKVDDCYYAFGTGVCARIEGNKITLPTHYDKYIKAFEINVDRKDAWRIFHKLMFIASIIKGEKGYNGEVLKSFNEFNFNENQLKEIEKQVQRYMEYFKRYELKDYL